MAQSFDHEALRELFSAYHDGELAEPDRKRVAEHLGACADCARDYEGFRTTLGAMSSLKQAAPQDFVGAVKGQIRARSRGRFFTRPAPRFGQWTLSVISLVTLIVTVLIYYFAALSSQ